MFEHRNQPILSRKLFLNRVINSVGIALMMLIVSLVFGMSGYRYFENMSPVDAFFNASMIMSGMGPAAELESVGGKVFAGCFALYSGLCLIVVTGLLLAPPVHRMLHSFHHAGAKLHD